MFQLQHQTVLEGKQLGCQTVFDFEPPAANWFGAKTLVPNCFDIELQHQTVLEVKGRSKLLAWDQALQGPRHWPTPC